MSEWRPIGTVYGPKPPNSGGGGDSPLPGLIAIGLVILFLVGSCS